ncbi:hypothetical protein GZH44_00145 [Weissella hellenica]|nr:hypothetical protein GZH44_00145 [Weissella hellenica]
MEINFINNGTPILSFNNIKNFPKYSIHIWKISLNYKNDKTSVHISGWQSKDVYSFRLSEPGKYYATIFLPNNSKFNTRTIEITYDDLFKFSDQSEIKVLSDYLIKENKVAYDTQILLQKMFIVGSQKIQEHLSEYVKEGSELSIFSSESTVSISNAIFSMSFFENKINVPKFYSDKTVNKGYLYSMTFRSYLQPVEYATFKKDDVLLIVDSENSESKRSLIAKAKQANATILDIYELVHQAYIDKYLVTPLQQLNNKTIFINLPTSSKIKNPSDGEKRASKITIGTVRNNLRKKDYPDVLRQFDDEYITEVLDGWKLKNYTGYDKLVDSQSKYVNIVNGHRQIKINGQNFINSDGRVLFFGNSVIYGIGSDDDHTLPSLFAKKSNIHTENMANFSMNDFVRATNLIKQMNFRSNDIIVIGVHLPLDLKLQAKVDQYVDMQPYFDHPRLIDDDVFIDMTHMNKNGYEIMAHVLTEKEIII